MRLNPIYLIIGLALLSSCTYFNKVDETSIEQHIVDVKLEINAPFSTASILIVRNGDLIYVAESQKTSIEQLETKKISFEEFEELSDLINNNNFLSFDSEYIDENLMDATTYVLTVRSFPASYDPALADPGVYSVKCYGDCPREIVEIINRIKQLWGQQILEVGV